MDFQEFQEKFGSERKVIEYFIKQRYPEGIKCHFCNSEKVYQRKKTPKVFDCGFCGRSFSIFKDTIFEKTTTDLRKWMYAIHLFLNAKKGISAKQLQREIGVTYKTAWRMLHQIRKAMSNNENQKFVNTILEIDETYVGGKPRKSNKRDNNKKGGGQKRGRGTDKTPIVGIVSRNDNKVYAKVALTNRKGQKLTGQQLIGILTRVALDSSKNVVISDEFSSYDKLRKTKFIHLRIDHTKMYADDLIHTNTIESFWAIVKRAAYGIYHRISVKYLQDYINEFCFRFNNRNIDNSFDLLMSQSVLTS
jgi:transposase-like protein